MEKAYFSVKNITAGYGKKKVINNVSFKLPRGALTAVLGANGCGKTTLMRCVINQLKHEGSCILCGEQLERLSQRELARRVSYISQQSVLDLSIPVLDVVLMGFNCALKLFEYPNQAQRQAALNALESVGLSSLASSSFLTLSQGQKQLVMLARALAENTALMVFDEPDSALDFNNRYTVMEKLKNLVKCGEKSALLCLHDPMLALAFCDKIMLMSNGAIMHELMPEHDDAETIQKAMRDVYGNVSVNEYFAGNGKRHLNLIWEG